MNPDKIRKVYAPYSTTGEQVGQTALEGYVDVAQAIYPAVNTGQIGKDGEWSGITVSDKEFIGFSKGEAIANGGTFLAPDTNNFPSIDMTGYSDLFIAIKPTNAGNMATTAVMGPDTKTFANLSPLNSGQAVRGTGDEVGRQPDALIPLYEDGGESLAADVWNIYLITSSLKGQKNLQFNLTNNSGGESTIEFAFLRMV